MFVSVLILEAIVYITTQPQEHGMVFITCDKEKRFILTVYTNILIIKLSLDLQYKILKLIECNIRFELFLKMVGILVSNGFRSTHCRCY